MDLTIYETNNGGDLYLEEEDLLTTESFFNAIYLAWFGGNVGNSTKESYEDYEQRMDWFGNAFISDANLQYNSLLEATLSTTDLTASSLEEIERVALADLGFIRDLADVTVSVELHSHDTVKIIARVRQLDNLEELEFQVIWNATSKERILYVNDTESDATFISSEWILKSGFWKDKNIWSDEAVWID